MRTISQILSRNAFVSQTKENSDEKSQSASGGEQNSKRIESDIVRVPREELMQDYVTDPIVFNSVNKYVQIIMAAGHHFEGSEESVKGANKFFNNIGMYGGEIDDEILLADTFKHQFVVGGCWHENIYNKAGKKLVDLDLINPITIDYVRDASGKAILDDYGNPKGYVQKLDGDIDIDQKYENEIPKDADVSEKLFLPPWKVTHFKLYTIGDNLDGLGLVEPIHNSGNRKLNIEQGYANAARRLGYPIITAEIGDNLHEPTNQQKIDTLNEISNVDYKSSFAFPYYVKLGLLESKKPEKLSEHLDYFQNAQITGLGIPQAFASGSGEATNRSTLARQEYIMKLSLKDVIKRTIRVIYNKQLKVLAEQNGWPDVPRLVWGEVSLEELDSKAERIVSYAKAGLLKPTDNIEKYIKHIEGLPE
jgi:hypothetical protein